MTQSIMWKTITIDPTELCLNKVLRCGQAFRWRFIDEIWSCSIRDRILLLKQRNNELLYSSIPPMKDTDQLVHEYFHLDVKLKDLYAEWCTRDPRFLKNSARFQGIRMLDQDPWENLICFICSSNNNVKRISKMCESLCVYYGEYLGTFQEKPHHSFPNAEALAGDSIEQELRDLGFGYRAKFINQTAKRMVDNPDMHDSLVHGKLRTKSRAECQEFLLEFPGVGPKVADCVALMSLDEHDVVPVDTHVYQIAKRDYKFRSTTKNKTMTKNVYDEIQQFFVCLWGDYAGWAHSLLFAADLRDLENGINDTKRLPSKRPLEDENDPVVVKRLESKNNRDSVV